MTETIYALASGAGRAGVAVIRVSGPATPAAVRALTGRPMPPPRTAVRAPFDDPATSERLDDGLLLWFPAPHSAHRGQDSDSAVLDRHIDSTFLADCWPEFNLCQNSFLSRHKLA